MKLVIVMADLNERHSFRTNFESKKEHIEVNRDWNKYCTGLPGRDQV